MITEQPILQDVFTALTPIAPSVGGQVKLFIGAAPPAEQQPWVSAPYWVIRFQSPLSPVREFDGTYRARGVVAVTMYSPTAAFTEQQSIITTLHLRLTVLPDGISLMYRWLGSGPTVVSGNAQLYVLPTLFSVSAIR